MDINRTQRHHQKWCTEGGRWEVFDYAFNNLQCLAKLQCEISPRALTADGALVGRSGSPRLLVLAPTLSLPKIICGALELHIPFKVNSFFSIVGGMNPMGKCARGNGSGSGIKRHIPRKQDQTAVQKIQSHK